MNTSYQGKVCVITGASTGIGFGLSKKLLELGATVWMCSRTPENVEAAGEQLKGYGSRVHSEVIDVRSAEQVTDYLNRIAAEGPIDYLFNNAGVAQKGIFADVTPQIWEDVMSANFYGVVHGVTAAIPIMLKQGYGNIINTASVCGIAPLPYQTVYCASKYAVVGFSEALRYEYADNNIRVWVVCPAAVDTMIFKRDQNYMIHEEFQAPPEAISIEDAAIEILEGMETYTGILPIVDFARLMYESIGKDPKMVDDAMLAIKKSSEESFDELKTRGIAI